MALQFRIVKGDPSTLVASMVAEDYSVMEEVAEAAMSMALVLTDYEESVVISITDDDAEVTD